MKPCGVARETTAGSIMEQSDLTQTSSGASSALLRPSRLPLARSSAGKSLIPRASTDTLRSHHKASMQSDSHPTGMTQSLKPPSRIVPTSRSLAAQRSTGASQTPSRTLPRSQSSSQPCANGVRSVAARSTPSASSATVMDSSGQAEAYVQIDKKPPRNTRLSLAERTMESISKVPPSPANRRRRSSFFQQQSPMPTSRPSSSLASSRVLKDHETVPVPPIRPEHLPSSTKSSAAAAGRTIRSPVKTSMASRTVSASLRPQQSTQAAVRSSSPSKARRPLGSSNTVAARPKTTRPALAGLHNPPNMRKDAAAEDQAPKAAAAAKSSSALREQIRAAKAAKRDMVAKTAISREPDLQDVAQFDLETDPFNQLPKDGSLSFRKKIDLARSEGRLNISGLNLKEIPEDVIKMYDFEHNNKHNSSIAWNETVDVVKFIAADNEIEFIPEHVFPDVDPRVESLNDESATPQFGGIEVLDFRGNLLFDLPVGLRRLERLTSLNLSRNRLMNDALDIIFQITCLKELRLSDNVLTGELSPSIAALKQLEVLEVQNNKLCLLPDEMSELIHLRELILSNNQLVELPMEKLSQTALVTLLAAKNQLQGCLFIADDVSMSRLQSLDVSANTLTSITTSTISLPKLQDLNISYNRITELPSMTSCLSLISLFAEENKMSQIPNGFTDLKSLRVVDFTGNEFSRLDPRIGLMDKLEVFKVAANPIRERKFLTIDTATMKRDLKARLGLDEPGQEVD